jgi:hypothetical protein
LPNNDAVACRVFVSRRYRTSCHIYLLRRGCQTAYLWDGNSRDHRSFTTGPENAKVCLIRCAAIETDSLGPVYQSTAVLPSFTVTANTGYPCHKRSLYARLLFPFPDAHSLPLPTFASSPRCQRRPYYVWTPRPGKFLYG